MLKETAKNIEGALENNFKNLSTEKYDDYREAQDHFKNNVIPFESKLHRSVRNLLVDPRRPVDKKLYSDLLKNNEDTNKVRNLLGLSADDLRAGRSLHSRLAPAILTSLGLAYGGKKIAESLINRRNT